MVAITDIGDGGRAEASGIFGFVLIILVLLYVFGGMHRCLIEVQKGYWAHADFRAVGKAGSGGICTHDNPWNFV